MLYHIAELCDGYSGRTLRKLPLIAHAVGSFDSPVRLPEFLASLQSYVTEQKMNEKHWPCPTQAPAPLPPSAGSGNGNGSSGNGSDLSEVSTAEADVCKESLLDV